MRFSHLSANKRGKSNKGRLMKWINFWGESGRKHPLNHVHLASSSLLPRRRLRICFGVTHPTGDKISSMSLTQGRPLITGNSIYDEKYEEQRRRILSSEWVMGINQIHGKELILRRFSSFWCSINPVLFLFFSCRFRSYEGEKQQTKWRRGGTGNIDRADKNE